MKNKISVGKLFGINIEIDRSWFLILALVSWTLARGYFPANAPGLSFYTYWIAGFIGALLLFICVLFHEMGHSLMARFFGIPVNRITLFIFGGMAEINWEPKKASVELLIASAGPIVSVLLSFGAIYISKIMPVENESQLLLYLIMRHLGLVNAALFLFNLLPGFPLDGGRLTRSLIWAWSGNFVSATKVASFMGSVIGICLVVLGIFNFAKQDVLGGFWYVALGVFLRDAAKSAYENALMRSLLEDLEK